jgi:hypothetical protein
MAVVISVVLNALFRLGAWRYGQLRLGTDAASLPSASFDKFFSEKAAIWKISAAEVERIRGVVDHTIELIEASAEGPLTVLLGSDGFDVTVAISYRGNLPMLPDLRPPGDLVEEQSFVSGLSGCFCGIHADLIERSAKDNQCEIKLTFRI